MAPKSMGTATHVALLVPSNWQLPEPLAPEVRVAGLSQRPALLMQMGSLAPGSYHMHTFSIASFCIAWWSEVPTGH